MIDNVISFAGMRAVLNGEKTIGELHAEALDGLSKLSCVNLLALEPRARQLHIRTFAELKALASISSPPFGERVRSEVQALGRQLTTDETNALLDAYDPNARRVFLA